MKAKQTTKKNAKKKQKTFNTQQNIFYKLGTRIIPFVEKINILYKNNSKRNTTVTF